MTNKGAIPMKNQLTEWYNISKADEVKSEIKNNIKRNYGFSDGEFVSIGGGYKFLFDDETNGEIAITFEEEKDALRVTVSGTWSWEVIEIRNQNLPIYGLSQDIPQEVSHDPT